MFDYLIKNGQLIDGTGSPARRADVGITDGKIAAIGDLSAAQAGTVIDAQGRPSLPALSTSTAMPTRHSSARISASWSSNRA